MESFNSKDSKENLGSWLCRRERHILKNDNNGSRKEALKDLTGALLGKAILHRMHYARIHLLLAKYGAECGWSKYDRYNMAHECVTICRMVIKIDGIQPGSHAIVPWTDIMTEAKGVMARLHTQILKSSNYEMQEQDEETLVAEQEVQPGKRRRSSDEYEDLDDMRQFKRMRSSGVDRPPYVDYADKAEDEVWRGEGESQESRCYWDSDEDSSTSTIYPHEERGEEEEEYVEENSGEGKSHSQNSEEDFEEREFEDGASEQSEFGEERESERESEERESGEEGDFEDIGPAIRACEETSNSVPLEQRIKPEHNWSGPWTTTIDELTNVPNYEAQMLNENQATMVKLFLYFHTNCQQDMEEVMAKFATEHGWVEGRERDHGHDLRAFHIGNGEVAFAFTLPHRPRLAEAQVNSEQVAHPQ